MTCCPQIHSGDNHLLGVHTQWVNRSPETLCVPSRGPQDPSSHPVQALPGTLPSLSAPILQGAGTSLDAPVTPDSFSRVRLLATPWTVAPQAPLPRGFSRQEHCSGLPFPPPGEFPDPWKEMYPLSVLEAKGLKPGISWTMLCLKAPGGDLSLLLPSIWCLLAT